MKTEKVFFKMSTPKSRKQTSSCLGEKREEQGGHEEGSTKGHKEIGGNGNTNHLVHGDGFLTICICENLEKCTL